MPVLTPGEQLLQGMDTNNLKQLLHELPAQILIDRLKDGESRKAVAEVQSRLSLREAELRQDVVSAYGPDGKKLHSNDTARDAALLQTKAQDDVYQMLQAELRQAQSDADQAAAQLRFGEDKFSAVKVAGRLVAAEIELLAEK